MTMVERYIYRITLSGFAMLFLALLVIISVPIVAGAGSEEMIWGVRLRPLMVAMFAFPAILAGAQMLSFETNWKGKIQLLLARPTPSPDTPCIEKFSRLAASYMSAYIILAVLVVIGAAISSNTFVWIGYGGAAMGIILLVLGYRAARDEARRLLGPLG